MSLARCAFTEIGDSEVHNVKCCGFRAHATQQAYSFTCTRTHIHNCTENHRMTVLQIAFITLQFSKCALTLKRKSSCNYRRCHNRFTTSEPRIRNTTPTTSAHCASNFNDISHIYYSLKFTNSLKLLFPVIVFVFNFDALNVAHWTMLVGHSISHLKLKRRTSKHQSAITKANRNQKNEWQYKCVVNIEIEARFCQWCLSHENFCIQNNICQL